MFFKLDSNVTLEDLAAFNTDIIHFLDAGMSPVHLIIDVDKVGSIPLSISTIVKHLSFRSHPKIGWIIISNPPGYMKMIATIVFQLVRVRMRMVNTLPEALNFLREMDISLDWKQADNSVLQETQKVIEKD